MPSPTPPEGYITIEEAAVYTRLSAPTILRALRAAALRGVKNGRWLTRREWVDSWLEHRRKGGPS